MSQQIVSTWDGVANTNSWVHDGDVERSAVDIVELASSVAGHSAGAQAAADAASGYANTASAAVASIGTAATDAVAAVQSAGNAEINDLYSAADTETSAMVAVGSSWINTLTSSGGIVTSAVGDAGTAQILAVTSAGGVQVALVSAAGTSATGDLAAVTAAQSAALVSAGGYQSGLIATAGSAQIAAVQAEGGTQIAAVQLAASAQVNSATVAAMSAGAAASTAQGAASAASGYAVSAGNFAAVTSGYMVSAGGYATSAGSAADAASGYALTASSYMTSAGGYASAASDSADAAAASAASIAGEVEQIGINTKDIANIQSLLNGALSTPQTDSTSAYAKTVPAKAQPYAAIESVGGKTIVRNQLVVNGNFAENVSWALVGVTMSVADNTATLTNTGSGDKYAQQAFYGAVGHKYCIRADVWTDTAISNIFQIFYGGGSDNTSFALNTVNTWTTLGGIVECATTQYNLVRLRNPTGGATCKFRNVNLFDLTLMFGAGNEPSTFAEVQAMFPASYYAYNPGELISAGVTSIVSKDADSATLATLPIPAAVQSLPGYGWSAGSVCNEVDWERKVYVQRVGSVDLGTLSWGYNASYGFYGNPSGFPAPPKFPSNLLIAANILCQKYPTTYVNAIVAGVKTNVIGLGGSYLYVGDTSYTSAADFKSAMSGVLLYYELETPIETDISQYLTDDNLLAVEPSGTVSFPSVLGDDYRLPVPSDVEYTIDLAPDTPSTDGTYTLQCVVADGVPTYSWVSA